MVIDKTSASNFFCREIEIAPDRLYFGTETGYHVRHLAACLFLGKMLHIKQEVLYIYKVTYIKEIPTLDGSLCSQS